MSIKPPCAQCAGSSCFACATQHRKYRKHNIVHIVATLHDSMRNVGAMSSATESPWSIAYIHIFRAMTLDIMPLLRRCGPHPLKAPSCLLGGIPENRGMESCHKPRRVCSARASAHRRGYTRKRPAAKVATEVRTTKYATDTVRNRAHWESCAETRGKPQYAQ